MGCGRVVFLNAMRISGVGFVKPVSPPSPSANSLNYFKNEGVFFVGKFLLFPVLFIGLMVSIFPNLYYKYVLLDISLLDLMLKLSINWLQNCDLIFEEFLHKLSGAYNYDLL